MTRYQMRILRYVKKTRTVEQVARKMKMPKEDFSLKHGAVFTPELYSCIDFDRDKADYFKSPITANTKGIEIIEADSRMHNLEIVGWVRWGITTIIAIVALLNSIFARLGL